MRDIVSDISISNSKTFTPLLLNSVFVCFVGTYSASLPTKKKGRPTDRPHKRIIRPNLSRWLRFAQTCNAVPILPLTPLLQNFNAFEALENVALSAERAGSSETTML